jgi:hypothetical protein
MKKLIGLIAFFVCILMILPVSALDGYVILIKSGSRYGTGNLVVRNMATGDEQLLVEDRCISACFSPDATEIVYGTGSKIAAVPAVGGNIREILNSGTGGKDYVQWATDGYIYWTGGSRIYRTKADGSGSRETYWDVPGNLSGSGFRYWSLAQNGKWAGASPRISGDGRSVFLNLEKKTGDRFATGCQVSCNNAGTAITYAIDGHRKWYIKRVENHSSVGSTIKSYSQGSSIAGHRFSHFTDDYVMYATESGMNAYLRDVNTDDEISCGKGRPWDYYPGELKPIEGVRVSIMYPSSGTAIEGGSTITVIADAQTTEQSITKVEFFFDDQKVGEDADSVYQMDMALATAGDHTIMVTAADDKGNTDTSEVTITVAVQEPYGGTACAVPGKLEAEDFDEGGNGLSWYDKSTGNRDGQYRTDVDVDINTCDEGGYYLTSTEPGEWVEYTLDVKKSGKYDLLMRVRNVSSDGAFHIDIDGENVSGSVAEGANDAWQTLTVSGVELPQGTHVMRMTIDVKGYVFNWFEFPETSFQPTRFAVRSTRSPARTMMLRRNEGRLVLSGYSSEGGKWRLLDMAGKKIGEGKLGRHSTVITDAVQPADQIWLLNVESGEMNRMIRISSPR